MSHEIRTPLNAILGYAQLLSRDGELSEKQKKSLHIIEQSGNHLLGVLNDILDISKIEAGKMELHKSNFNLYHLLTGIAQVFQEQCTEKGLNWYEEFSLSNTQLVYSDAQKLRQILINLIGNAIKFTEQGSISLTVKRIDNEYYYFEVSDTGPGIAEDDIEAIFTGFHQAPQGVDKGGAGLGLAITRSQLQLLGSEIKVESETGKGSIFSFTLALENAQDGIEVVHDNVSEIIRLSSSDMVKALVVDDSELSRNLLVDMLEDVNAQVSSAINGQEALQLIEQTNVESKPDIVFMDIRMPVMNGIDAVRQIKQNYGDQIVCIAITSTIIEQTDSQYYQAGFDDYIAKPYRFEAVFECMKKHLQIDFENKTPLLNENIEISDIDFTLCQIDKSLYEELLQAAIDYNSPLLSSLIMQLSSLGDEEIKLAKKLNHLLEQYDIHSLVNLVKCIKPVHHSK